METIDIHYPYGRTISAMLTPVQFWSLPPPPLAFVSLNLFRYQLAYQVRSSHPIAALASLFVLSNALPHIFLTTWRPVDLWESKHWILTQQGKLRQYWFIFSAKLMSQRLFIHSSVNIEMHYCNGGTISALLTLAGFWITPIRRPMLSMYVPDTNPVFTRIDVIFFARSIKLYYASRYCIRSQQYPLTNAEQITEQNNRWRILPSNIVSNRHKNFEIVARNYQCQILAESTIH